MISFALNNEWVNIKNLAPNLSILDWLRTKNGKCGTKEGCASGDCGACTVLIGKYQNGQWKYQHINACLMLVASLDGKHLITIEGVSEQVKTQGGELHPVQQAMIECHGSQCGFCTPGFIMSLMALYLNHKSYPGKNKVIQYLGGNLCRCTGYQPILMAAEQSFTYPRQELNIESIQQKLALYIKQKTENAEIELSDGETGRFFMPNHLTTLLQLKVQYPKAKLFAGGTDLSLEFTQALKQPETIIGIADVDELRHTQFDSSGIFIGAGVPYADFMEAFCQYYPEAHELFERLGSAQIRHSGTLGGSIGNASPIGDPAPLLIALNCEIELTSLRGKRRLLLESFFIDYKKTKLQTDEVITGFYLPPRANNLKLACYKVSKRIEDDISTVCMVLAYQTNQQQTIINARCAFGGMAAIPKRAFHAEQRLIQQPASLTTFQQAGEQITNDFTPLSDVRASDSYRLSVANNLFTRAWYELEGRIDVSKPQTRIKHAAL
ncbi:xanthine dehydrogenase small subunit [Gayadomonas joobiniege]|uniref:xanthine dehydrogenase small subunit n=1 Tax=Gayadomonas joobiniege TaxID=1234606 RepID=UPI0004751BD7|nr:xanthine dehydrogenase small subunit [Gayadomonas joobiniege]